MEVNKPLETTKVESKYKCECGWIGTRKEMIHEEGEMYDQDLCPKCHNVLFDDQYNFKYCEDVEPK